MKSCTLKRNFDLLNKEISAGLDQMFLFIKHEKNKRFSLFYAIHRIFLRMSSSSLLHEKSIWFPQSLFLVIFSRLRETSTLCSPSFCTSDSNHPVIIKVLFAITLMKWVGKLSTSMRLLKGNFEKKMSFRLFTARILFLLSGCRDINWFERDDAIITF
jgi:hypothetical protein